MHIAKITNLISLEPENRYNYFIRYCSDFEQVCGLSVGDSNWVIFKDSGGNEIFPLWPHPDIAEACCFEEHIKIGASPQLITIDSFINRCIPDMITSHVLFGVFYDKSRVGVAVSGDVLRKDIQEEINSVWE